MKDHIIDVVFVLEDLVTAVRQLNDTMLEFKTTKKSTTKKAHAPKEYSVAFNEWWETYPKLPRTGKRNTWELWWKLIENEFFTIRKQLKIATENYSSHIVIHGRLARDPERFLKDSWWKGWLNDGDHESDNSAGANETKPSGTMDSPSMG